MANYNLISKFGYHASSNELVYTDSLDENNFTDALHTTIAAAAAALKNNDLNHLHYSS